MMRLFRRYVLGGKTDTTEGTLFAFLVGVVWFTWVIAAGLSGTDVSTIIGPVATYLMATVGAFAGAKVVGNLKSPGDPGNLPQEPQGGLPVGDWSPEVGGSPETSAAPREVYPR